MMDWEGGRFMEEAAGFSSKRARPDGWVVHLQNNNSKI